MGFVANLHRAVLVKLAMRARELKFRWEINDLIARGLTVGKNVTIRAGARIDPDFPYLISIGDNCVINGGVCLLAHDPTIVRFTDGCLRLGRVDIRENCFIGQNSLVLAGVTVGPNVVVAAGSVVDRDVPSNSCVAGVPARVYANLSDLLERHEKRLEECSVFDYYDLVSRLDEELRARVKRAVAAGDTYAHGYVTEYPYLINGDGDKR